MSDDSDSSNYSNEGRNSTAPAYSGPMSPNWDGGGATTRFYGDVQKAAAAGGFSPSMLSTSLPNWSKYIPGGTALNALNSGVGYLQDHFGLPGYAKTDSEWNAQTNPTGNHGGSGEYGHTGDYSSALLASMGAGGGQGGSIADLAAGAMNLGSASGNDTADFTMPTFDPDPSGMIAGGKAYMDDYARSYQPYAQKMRQEVDRTGTPEYFRQQRGAAMTDVQQQYDAGMGAERRRMAGMGVNPNSGRFAAMGQQGAIRLAAAKVNAAAAAEGLGRKNYQAGLSAVNTMGIDASKMGQGWAGVGNDAAKTNMAWGLGSGELGLKNRTTTQDNAVNWGRIATERYGIDKGVQRTQMTNDAQSDNSTKENLWGLAGLALQNW